MIKVSFAFEQKKTLEYGVGLLSLNTNHYRGSDQRKDWFIPLPYFSYKSKRLEAEPSYIRGTLFTLGDITFKLSLNAGLSVESETNAARMGMKDLGYTFELGPMMIYRIWTSEDKMQFVKFEMPVRQVFATNLTSRVDTIGLFSIPYVSYTILPNKKTRYVGLEFSVGPMFATSSYHDYYYGVKAHETNGYRHKYSGQTGYSGTQVALVLNRRFNDLIVLPFFRYDYLPGAVFTDSPLYKKDSYQIVGLGLFWLFG
jgi:outer membrane scaffolding protein for murein synthesis (MipA/OmpV family)